MPKGKKFFTAALAVAKIKKNAKASVKKKELKKQPSSSASEYSDGSSEYSSSEYTSGDEDSEGEAPILAGAIRKKK